MEYTARHGMEQRCLTLLVTRNPKKKQFSTLHRESFLAQRFDKLGLILTMISALFSCPSDHPSPPAGILPPRRILLISQSAPHPQLVPLPSRQERQLTSPPVHLILTTRLATTSLTTASTGEKAKRKSHNGRLVHVNPPILPFPTPNDHHKLTLSTTESNPPSSSSAPSSSPKL